MKTVTTSKKISTHIRLDRKVKRDAQKAAKSIKLPLSSIVNNYLYYFAKNKDVAFEYPSPRLVAQLKKIQKEIKQGQISRTFANASEMIEDIMKESD